MSKDISSILAGWEHDADQLSVRLITGDDGREKIQLRLDLGLLQMDLNGRPDGQRPEGYESWLEYFEEREAAADERPEGDRFELSSDECERLLREGVQYYHRYLSFWHLNRYDLCARDTERNLRLFAFVRKFAKHERDKLQFDQWRPYVTMMHARAVATPMIERGEVPAALKTIDRGIRNIQSFLDEYKQAGRSGECSELQFLQKWRRDLAGRPAGELRPPDAASDLDQLNDRLQQAVAAEQYEEAARLRDEIRRKGPAD